MDPFELQHMRSTALQHAVDLAKIDMQTGGIVRSEAQILASAAMFEVYLMGPTS